jgi:hypothetical protein
LPQIDLFCFSNESLSNRASSINFSTKFFNSVQNEPDKTVKIHVVKNAGLIGDDDTAAIIIHKQKLKPLKITFPSLLHSM